MKQSNKEIEMNYKAIDLYNIVLDSQKYPEYIPWCSNIKILNIKDNEIKATMVVDYKFFPTQHFISLVFYDLKKLSIKTKYIDGPLEDLITVWKFIDLPKNKSKIQFNVEFKFKNFFHQKFAELFFPLIESKMINSFIKRADETLK